MNCRYLPAGRRELDRGMEYYEEKSVGLGGEFLDEVEAAISRILATPRAWTQIKPGIRRCLTNRFPYCLLYHFLEEQQEVLIVALMNTYQKPDYWNKRI